MIDFDLIWKKIHNRLSSDEEEQLRRWIEDDESHREYFNSIRDFYLDKENTKRTPLHEKQLSGAMANRQGNKHITRRLLIYGTSVAAAVAIMLVVFLWNGDRGPTTETAMNTQETMQLEKIVPGSRKATLLMDDGNTYILTEESRIETEIDGIRISSSGESLSYSQKEAAVAASEMKYNTLRVPRGGEYFLLLSDSTRVWINSESEVRYPVQFAGDHRTVELTGEAYFEVSGNPDKPFQVISSGQLVEVLGTKFNISSYEEDPSIYTTLVEGRVQVSSLENASEPVLLLPNDQGIFNKADKGIITRDVDPSSYIAWTEGRFVFCNQRMDSIMLVLQRWYDIDVRFQEKSLKELCFTGNIKRYTDFEQILKLLQDTNEMEYEISERTVMLK